MLDLQPAVMTEVGTEQDELDPDELGVMLSPHAEGNDHAETIDILIADALFTA